MYSIDTNLLIGLINEEDNLHQMTTCFLKSKGYGSLFILSAALEETKGKFLKYYNDALTDVQYYYNTKNKLPTLDELIGEKPKLGNFYRRILEDLKKEPVELAFVNLRSKAIRIISTLEERLSDVIGRIEFSPFGSEFNEEQMELIKQLSKINFQDSHDRQIFIEFIATSLIKTELTEFYSNDEKFMIRAREATKKVNIQRLFFYHIKPLEAAPFYAIN